MKVGYKLRWMAALLLAGVALLAQAAPAVDARAAATRLLDHLDAGDYAAAEAMLDPRMAAAVPADKLKAVWESLPAQAGVAKGRGEASVTSQQGVQLVAVPLHYAQAAFVAKVAVRPDGTIAGFLIQPAPPPAAAAPAADAPYVERDLAVGSGALALPATLALPKGAGPFAAVVLVHGSGPQDRDETIGANRPFLDLARGLAERGVAVLRYEKRTRAHPQAFAAGDFTVDAETTDDAVAAVDALRAQPGIDPARVFVLGHSQGGMLAPRIAQRSGHVAGIVLLAAPARSLLDLLPEQNRYLLADGGISAEEQAFLDDLDRKIAAIRSDAAITAADTPLNLPPAYWRSFDRIDPVAEAQAAGVPMLLLQGGRDFQVIDTDWQRWRAAFAQDPRARFHHYPALNHLGIAGEGPGSIAEYGRAGRVDTTLVADIAAWIQAQPARR